MEARQSFQTCPKESEIWHKSLSPLPPSPSLLSPSTIDLNFLYLWRSLLHRQLPLLQLEMQVLISQPPLQLRTGGRKGLHWVLAQELITLIAENAKFVPERRGSCSVETAPGVGSGGGSGIRDKCQHCPWAQRCCPLLWRPWYLRGLWYLRCL